MVFKLMRLKHWVKNIFIFLPLFFGSELFNLEKTANTLIVFFGFSFVCSGIYILNDIFDIEFDKIHYEKKNRPIASGKISKIKASYISAFLLMLGLFITFVVSIESLYITGIYIILNILYSTILKHIPIIDFVVISLGFVLRILLGGIINDIPLSEWIIILVLLLSIFIAVSKRRDDVFDFETNNNINRKVVEKYTVAYLDKIITIISSVLIVSYLLFITSDEVVQRYDSLNLLITFLFVLIGVFRYNHLTYVYNKSGSPIKILFEDIFLQIVLLLWGATFFIILYKNYIF